jgi:hypothetical protein
MKPCFQIMVMLAIACIAVGISGCPWMAPPGDDDGCPDDPNKTSPGLCGCGVSDVDTDGDGTPDCNDSCPNDPQKTSPGVCGCGVSDVDSDGDGTPDCNDSCPNDPKKTSPGVCGCGVSDVDTDGDGTPDCNEPKVSAALPAKTIGYDLVGIHDPKSAAYSANCVGCHGDRTNEVALDGVTPTAHSRMLFSSFGTGNARCVKCHNNGVDFLSFSAGGLREPVDMERDISSTESSCTSCHGRAFYVRSF